MSRQQLKHGAARTAGLGPAALLHSAAQHHRAGRLAEAEALYCQVLDADPRAINALNLMGVLAQQTGRLAQAIELFGRAIAADDRQPALHVNLARAYAAAGNGAAAEAAFRRAAGLAPAAVEHQVELANHLLASGRPADAAPLYRQALAAQPNQGGLSNNLGAALRDLGQLPQAITCFHRALALAPAPEAFNNLAATLNDLGNAADAERAARSGLALGAGYADLHNNLGNALARRGRHAEALATFEAALAREPGLAEAHNNRANALKELGRIDESIDGFRAALALRPAYGEAMGNLGAAIQAKGRLVEAETCYRAALAMAPARGPIYSNLGTVLQAQGRMAEAAACFAQTLALDPDHEEGWSNRLFAIAFLPGFDDAAQFRANRAWAERAERRQHTLPPLANDRDFARRLRLGYVSPDFREHVLLRAFEGVIANHDRTGFELFCYADVGRPDARTQALAARFDGWRNVHGLDDDDRTQLMRADGIDILICLSGYLARDRRLFARRVAPVQVAYANHVSTTGLTTMDYRVTDPWLDPPGLTEAWNTERLVRLAGGYTCFSPEDEAPAVTPLPALANGYVTFGSFNNLAKLTPEALDLWARILAALPSARLMLKAGGFSEPAVARRYRDLLAARGVVPGRVDLVGWVPSKLDNNALFGRCDIALDPFPFNGGVTTQSALWMGLPVVTLAGPSFVGRLGRSILARVGLDRLVATDPDAYSRIALGLAGDLDGLARLRAGMRARLLTSAIFDHAGHTRELEAAYRDMWRRWCDGRNMRAGETGELR
jgi:predicted O-linked N-acetylglucosamine transferase (SPINDLY family)